MTQSNRDVNIVVLSFLLSLPFGCAPKPSKPTEPPPEKPGTSVPLHYPVMLFGGREIHVKADERTLITTNVFSGVCYPEFKMIDSDAKQYSILKETSFGKRSWFLDMGASPYQVYLELKFDGKIPLNKIKAEVLEVALQPHGWAGDSPRGPQIATEKIQGAKSIAELIDVCSRPWEWR